MLAGPLLLAFEARYVSTSAKHRDLDPAPRSAPRSHRSTTHNARFHEEGLGDCGLRYLVSLVRAAQILTKLIKVFTGVSRPPRLPSQEFPRFSSYGSVLLQGGI